MCKNKFKWCKELIKRCALFFSNKIKNASISKNIISLRRRFLSAVVNVLCFVFIIFVIVIRIVFIIILFPIIGSLKFIEDLGPFASALCGFTALLMGIYLYDNIISSELRSAVIIAKITYIYFCTACFTMTACAIYKAKLIPSVIFIILITSIYYSIHSYTFLMKYSFLYTLKPKYVFFILIFIMVTYHSYKYYLYQYFKKLLIYKRYYLVRYIKVLFLLTTFLLFVLHFTKFKSRFAILIITILTAHCFFLLRTYIKAYSFAYGDRSILLTFYIYNFFLFIYILLKVFGVYPIILEIAPDVIISSALKMQLKKESLRYVIDAIPENLKINLLEKSLSELKNTLEIVDDFIIKKNLEYTCDLNTLLGKNHREFNNIYYNVNECFKTRCQLFRLQIFRYNILTIIFLKF